MRDEIIYEKNFLEKLNVFLKSYKNEKIFILVDANTKLFCLNKIAACFHNTPIVIEIPTGEKNKNINTAILIWNFLSTNNADKNSLLINLGGGVITDIGGFIASTYQRGMDFINIPTTVLAQIDASIGGKNGINLNNIKNQIGVITLPKLTFISSDFLQTLPQEEILAGFAEMVKHALISSEFNWKKIKAINPEKLDFQQLSYLIKDSIEIKLKIVEKDLYEKGYRKALNFGHTIGHAIETFFSRKNIDIIHGQAVAIGIIAEIFISNKILNFDFQKLFEITEYVATYFKSFTIDIEHYDEIYSIMKHDKKNKDNQIYFSLLKNIGEVEIDKTCEKDDIIQALNFYYQLKK